MAKRVNYVALLCLILGINFSFINIVTAQNLEIPFYDSTQTITTHEGFTLLYNETHEQADWVAYELTASETDGPFERTDDFREDPSIITGSASLSDYRYSGYDRGHLIPAGDAQWSASVMSATFVLSNMTPQDPGFNRGDWRNLESNVRNWAKTNSTLYVVTGPALKQGIKERIGSNQVSVPRYYYKAILDYQKPEKKAIGFIVPNRELALPLSMYAVTIDSLESFTGFEFYPLLPEDDEKKIESHINKYLWDFASTSDRSYNTSINTKSSATRCNGSTQEGRQCKRRTTNQNGYCWQHQSQVNRRTYSAPKRTTSSRCAATTQKGTRCKRKAQSGNAYCWQHD